MCINVLFSFKFSFQEQGQMFPLLFEIIFKNIKGIFVPWYYLRISVIWQIS